MSLHSDDLLVRHAVQVCQKYGLKYKALSAANRKRIISYRCERCGSSHLLYHLDYSATNRPKCKLCGMMIQLGRSKYTRLRREVAWRLSHDDVNYQIPVLQNP